MLSPLTLSHFFDSLDSKLSVSVPLITHIEDAALTYLTAARNTGNLIHPLLKILATAIDYEIWHHTVNRR